MALACDGNAWVVSISHSVLLKSAPKPGTRKTAFLDRMLPAKSETQK